MAVYLETHGEVLHYFEVCYYLLDEVTIETTEDGSFLEEVQLRKVFLFVITTKKLIEYFFVND